MARKELYIHIAIWVIGLVSWMFWVEERIEIFQHFVDNYKNIGYVISTNDRQLGWYILISFFKAFFLLYLFYYIIPKFGFGRFAIHRTLLLFVGMMGTEYLVAKTYFAFLKTNSPIDYRLDWNYDFGSVLAIYLILMIIGWTLVAARNWIIEYQNLKKLYQTERSYVALKEQLSPHFLFNTVNNFYEIAVNEDNERLQNAILNLTQTLRYTIDYSASNEVALSKEIEAIQSYIELQKDRFEINEVELETSFNIEHPEVKITPLILLNYVENAFLHGYRYGEHSMIHIDILEKENRLQLSIENTDHSRRENNQGGNEKTKKMLELNYAGNYQLETRKIEQVYKTNLWIQLK